MSTIYLYDGHTTPVASSPLVDVIKAPPSTPVEIGTSFPVRIPENLSLPREPADVYDLVSLKVEALEQKTGFGDSLYEDFIENPSISTASPDLYSRRMGDRVSFALMYNPSYVWSTITNIGPATPDVVQLELDMFLLTYEADPLTGRTRRMLTDVSDEILGGTGVRARLDFQGTQAPPTVFTTVPGQPQVVAPAFQGSDFSVGLQGDFTQLSGNPLHAIIGFWGLFY